MIAILFVIVASGCACDDCVGGATIEHRTTATGPYDVELCIDGLCSGVVTIDETGSAPLEADWADVNASVWASTTVHGDLRIQIDVYDLSSGRTRPEPSEYRVMILPADGPALDETLLVTFDEERGTTACGVGATCWHSTIEI